METNPVTNPYQAPRADPGAAGTPAGAGGALIDEEIATFVEQNPGYYRDAWASVSQTGGFYAGFNLAALLASTLWLLYRRMYLAFAALLGIQTIGGVAAGVLARAAGGEVSWGVIGVMLVTKVGIGFVANGLYYRRFRRAVDQTRLSSGGAVNLPFLRTLGGTSTMAVVIGVVANMVLSALSR
jgi:hypothetical protein